MKIEIGESLGYSYLRHVKRCWLVQTNWKVSADWCKCMSEQDMGGAFLAMRDRFDPDGKVFKGTVDAGQFLRQAEIDVVGLDQDGGIHAMDVAFHEAGLNYGGGPHIRVLKKMLRTKLVLDAYHPERTKRDIYFVSPKVHHAAQQPLEEVFGQLRGEYPKEAWHLLTNDVFADEMLKPTVDRADKVADTSELFMRSAKLLKLAEAERPRRNSRSSGQEEDDREPRDEFQGIVRALMGTLLDSDPPILGEGRLRDLTDPGYCRVTMDLQLGGFALLRPQEQGREVSGRPRYWKRLYGGRFFVTNNWWPSDKAQNAESLLALVTGLISEQPDAAVVEALEVHQRALGDYIGR